MAGAVPHSRKEAAVVEEVTFTRAGALSGARQCLPFLLSDLAYGLVFGVLARQAGLRLAEVMLMSGLVVSGSAQLVVLGLWVAPLPVLAIALTTLIVNARYLVMGAALHPWLSRLSALKMYGVIFFLSDENWALAMREVALGRLDGAFLLGSGLLLTMAWVSSTAVGYLIGGAVPNLTQWGLDFAFVAVFIALLAGMWKGKSDLLPWLAAAVVAVAASFWLPGKWYILLGGLTGSLVGALRHAN